jgi:hypothetical protein
MNDRRAFRFIWWVIGFVGCSLLLVGGLKWASTRAVRNESIRKHEEVFERAVSTMNDLSAVLANINDVTTAQAAIPQIEAIGERMGEMLRDKVDLDITHRLSPKDKKYVAEKYEHSLQEAHQRYTEQIKRLGDDPEVASSVWDAVEEMFSTPLYDLQGKRST